MFHKYILDFPENFFPDLSKSVKFEYINKCRQGANLIDCANDLVPIVRTTTVYHLPNQKFLPIHYQIIDQIKKVSNYNNLVLNNALIEIYHSDYRTMGFHSDQALDLTDNSMICIYSGYDDPDTKDLRKLVIKNKTTNQYSNITLEHNSVVMFSTETNRNHLHKIVLDKCTTNTRWLGITFRQSKTFIKFQNEIPYFYPDMVQLTLANQIQQKEFYKLRSEENASTNYVYPNINYTISEGDLILVS
ncbi:hypothetical protein QJ857_gp0305 [Tupanvirus soda lake]|uniref:Alpha-ketoglutarate-dependent dioxygenase AlkB-like domain-containing protein n=2 Tax=Tupanvirus TaxID=2094720 RepID=A0A6N1NX25_9VIRU|nr:hypothetical protein QJ857_gp0305 [Tupanvirus soda lake]QKU35723.1 hypothetical protein [Tupanvirus soda lake]